MSDADTTNILVVDDLREKLLVYQTVLEDLGQNLIIAHSGEEALRLVLKHDFAVILLDVTMPGMDGFETAALIRKRRRSAHTPIIFLTAFADEVRVAEGYAHGAVDFILTPAVPDILRAKVRVFVDLYRMTQQVRRQAEERIALAEERTKRTAAEEATRRSNFLAEVSRALADSLDPDTTAKTLARQAVPFLADLAGVTLAGEHGQPWRTELAWAVPSEREPHALRLAGPDGPRDALRDAVERALAGGKPERLDGLDIEYPAEAGFSLPEDCRVRSAAVVPLRARGRTLGVLTLAFGPSGRRHDPSEFALAEDLAGRAGIALDNARLYKDVERADRQKNEFLSMLAHELRNPLAPIRNAAEVLRLAGPEQPQIRWAREVIDRQLTHLVRLVDDLLDVSRITRGKITLKPEPTDLAVVVAARGRGEPAGDRAGEPPAGGERPARAGVGQRRPGPADAGADEPAEQRGQVHRGGGAGRPDAGPGGRRGGGPGPRHGGRHPGGDARRGVRPVHPGGSVAGPLPGRAGDRADAGQAAGRACTGGRSRRTATGRGRGASSWSGCRCWRRRRRRPPASSAGRPAAVGCLRVLLVDDNVDGADSLATLVRLAGHEARVAHDGPAALEAAAAFRPQVVVLDIGLPGLTGYEVARRLRADPDLSGASLVAVTGYGRDEDRERARQAGFDHHLVKPVAFAELLNLLTPQVAAPLGR